MVRDVRLSTTGLVDRRSLIALGLLLKESGYRFVAVTPASHQRVLNQNRALGASLEAIFGWNVAFDREDVSPTIYDLLHEAGAITLSNGTCRSTVRFATADDLIFLHSGFPTIEHDTVFFGPDTYRFIKALKANSGQPSFGKPPRILDIGCGSGAGGISLARILADPLELILADINERAIEFSAINAAINDVPARTKLSDVLGQIDGVFDLIVANPPYLIDEDVRLYRHGGGHRGIDLSVRIVEESLSRLAAGGRLILYTGTPIASGIDPFFKCIRSILQLSVTQYSYEEVDPDMFGEELERPVYAGTDRIAGVVLTARKG